MGALWGLGHTLTIVLVGVVFGIGTVTGMVLITTAMAIPFAGAAARSMSAHRHLRVATGLLSFGFGVLLAYRIGVVDGLFNAVPRLSAR